MYFCVSVHMRVRVNVCVMKQMVLRPLCAIEKSPYVFAGLTKCKHTMLHREKIQIWWEMRRTVNTDQCFIVALLFNSNCTYSLLFMTYQGKIASQLVEIKTQNT